MSGFVFTTSHLRMPNDNHIVVDLGKVAYASLVYRSHSSGNYYFKASKPTKPTVKGLEVDSKALRYQSSETMLSYAMRRGLLDTWVPVLKLQLSNNHSLIYEGEKALSIWGEWRKEIFKK